MDLLTVVMHELGHVLGFGDQDPSSAGDSIMATVLTPGVRRSLAHGAGMSSVAGALADGTRGVPATIFAELGAARDGLAAPEFWGLAELELESGLLGTLAQGRT